MSSTNKTPNYDLPQWVETDEFKMADFNQAMSDIDSNLNLVDTTVASHLAENVSAVVLVNRDLSIEGVQNVAMTIKPKAVIALGVVQDQDNSITIGVLSGITQFSSSGRVGGVGKYGLTSRLLRIYGATNSDFTTGVATITATGLSIEWSKTGNGATGTIQVTLLGLTHGGI